MLRKSDSFVQLKDELEFVDDYLDIEVVRFGHDKLRIVKEIERESLEVAVPSVILQPLVENSIKHGLSPKIEGGTIYLRARIANRLLVIEVEDDGVGMESGGRGGTGIGMANVRERLQVLYGETAHIEINSQHGQRNAGPPGIARAESRRILLVDLRHPLQHIPIEALIVRNDQGAAEMLLRLRAGALSHVAQLGVIGEHLDGVARHRRPHRQPRPCSRLHHVR